MFAKYAVRANFSLKKMDSNISLFLVTCNRLTLVAIQLD